MTSNNIIDVNEVDFEYEVITFSQNIPVLVDFWAEWCGPCLSLSPLLEKIVNSSEGRFRLARVNVDKNPNLVEMFNVHNIPLVKAFSKGQAVSEFVGNQPENFVRDFISKIAAPDTLDLEIEKGIGMLVQGNWSESEQIFKSVMDTKPDSPAALLGLSKAYLAQGKADMALAILNDFPTSREYASAQFLLPLAQTLQKQQQKSFPQENDLDTAFINNIRLAGFGKIQPALDGLLDILRQDKHYRGKLAQEVILSLLEILGKDSEISQEYRKELATILF